MTIQELGAYCEDNDICQQYKKAVSKKFNDAEFYDVKLNSTLEERIDAVFEDFWQEQKNLSRKEVRHLLFEAEWKLSGCEIYRSGWVSTVHTSKNPKTVLRELEAKNIEILHETVTSKMITVIYKEKNCYYTMIITAK